MACVVLKPEDLVGRSHRPVEIGAPVMRADCTTFTHPDRLLAEFRTRVPIYCGDVELSVWQIERAACPQATLSDVAISWLLEEATAWRFEYAHVLPADGRITDEVILEVILEASPDLSDEPRPVARTPAGLVFELANFGCLMWDWGAQSLREGQAIAVGDRWRDARMTNAKGERFYARAFVDVTPELEGGDVADLARSACAQLRRRDAPTMGIARRRMEEVIRADCAVLKALCAARGCLGAALLPDAFEPITAMLVLRNDGNSRCVLFETARCWSIFDLTTS